MSQASCYVKDDYRLNIKPIDLHNAVILDTETLGLSNHAEICEISVIDAETGVPLLDTLIKPHHPIPNDVIKIHGITNEMVVDAPGYSEDDIVRFDLTKIEQYVNKK